MDSTAWRLIFEIIASVGSLSTFGAFIFLFRRDRDKQIQIDKLSGVVTSLDAQNETMKQQNELMVQQLEIFRNTSILKGNDPEAIIKLREIEEKKLKLSVRPNIWIIGSGCIGGTGELDITIGNKGEDAKLLEFKLRSNDIVLHNEHLPYDLDKGQKRKIFGRQKGDKHITNSEYEINIIYADKLNNKFSTIIKGVGPNARIEETLDVK